MKESTYSIHVVPDATTDGDCCYMAYHPELPGCMSHGKTVDEAVLELNAARELYLKTLDELGEPIPPKPQNPVFAAWKTATPISTRTIFLVDRVPKAELIPVQ